MVEHQSQREHVLKPFRFFVGKYEVVQQAAASGQCNHHFQRRNSLTRVKKKLSSSPKF